jgi:LPS O-antigen subunit length determinant protein (WzzB/FepE family)
MIQTEIQKEPVAVEKEQDVPRSEAEVSGLDTLVLLAGHKRFIVRFVLSAAALATLVAFLLPVRYEAKVLLSRIHPWVPHCWGNSGTWVR